MAGAGRSGVLRLSSGKHIRVVVFEEGRPVFGISNVPEDQLDVLLVRQRRLTAEQAFLAKRQIQKEQELAAKFVELGLLDEDTAHEARINQITRVVQSAMMMNEGEYLLDLAARVAHDISVDAPIHQWLLDTARNVTAEQARKLLGPPETQFLAAEPVGIEMSPLDSFLLTQITTPMSVDEIRVASGFPEEQSLPAIYALYAAGLLVHADAAAAAPQKELSIDEVREELDRLLGSYASASFYDVLSLRREADASDVKKAYYNLAKQYHPDRYHHASDPDIRAKLEAIFAQVSKAYDTLKDAKLRAEYDRRLGSGIPVATASAAAPTTVSAPPPVTGPLSAPPPRPIVAPPPSRPVAPPSQAAATPPVQQPAPEPDPLFSSPPPADEPAATAEPDPVTSYDPARLAEQHFQEGVRRFQNRDVMGAITMFREAVRQSPNKGVYHFHLGSALATNPRWHKEAEKHLLEASRSDPLNVEIFLKLGQIYMDAGLKKRAESQFRAVLSVQPHNHLARRALLDMGYDVPAPKGAKKGAPSDGGSLISKLFKRK